jgi:Ca2+/Na+ antiporter
LVKHPSSGTSDDSKGKNSTALVVGAVVGAIAVCVLVVVALMLLLYRRRHANQQSDFSPSATCESPFLVFMFL